MIANETCVCFALRDLPVDVQKIIVAHLKEPPKAPIKSKRLESFMKRWSDPNRPKIMPRVLFT
jgi:hypothetical protein